MKNNQTEEKAILDEVTEVAPVEDAKTEAVPAGTPAVETVSEEIVESEVAVSETKH